MTKFTADFIIRIGIEIIEWLAIILREKGGTNDSKGNTEKKREG